MFGTAGAGDTSSNSLAIVALLVTLPIFVVLFFRLRQAEKTEPTIRRDPSRKHAVQVTLVVTFLTGIFKIITYLYSLINGGHGFLDFSNIQTASPVADLLHTLITLVIAGTIFAYYWRDEHKGEEGIG
jgi:heme/copper-type cytochrome/quinol oxidase subunit 2